MSPQQANLAAPEVSWPARITSVRQLLAAMRMGFELYLEVQEPHGNTRFVLIRDGKRAPDGLLLQGVPIVANRQGLIVSGELVPDGLTPYHLCPAKED